MSTRDRRQAVPGEPAVLVEEESATGRAGDGRGPDGVRSHVVLDTAETEASDAAPARADEPAGDGVDGAVRGNGHARDDRADEEPVSERAEASAPTGTTTAVAASDVTAAEADAPEAAAPRASRWSLLASTLRRELRGEPAPDAAESSPDALVTDLPEIVPATVDVPGTARTGTATPEPDDPEEWTEMPADTVVRVPRDGRTVPLRPVGRRPRVRKVTRVVRHVDPWSTFKVALVFSAILYGVLLTAGVLLWNVALNTGTVDNIERWFTQFGWETFELNGGEIFHNAWIAGLFGMVGLTAFAVLCATLFNLVSDIVGGVRMTVLEEEVVERTITPSRRFVVRRAPSDVAWAADPVEESGG